LRSKYLALGLLTLVSFVGPFAESLVSGSVEPYGKWELAETFVALVLIFWWYHVDKAEHGYRAGPLLNGGMLLAVSWRCRSISSARAAGSAARWRPRSRSACSRCCSASARQGNSSAKKRGPP
jgi:hypothetical protein